MLATFGLQRIEEGLNPDTVSASDVAEFLQQAEAVDVDTLARDGMGHALDHLRQRVHSRELAHNGATAAAPPSRLPSQLYVEHRVNPEFQRTRHANPV